MLYASLDNRILHTCSTRLEERRRNDCDAISLYLDCMTSLDTGKELPETSHLFIPKLLQFI